MEYGVEIGSGAMIYIPSFMKTGSSIQKLRGGGGLTDTQHGDRLSLLQESIGTKTRLMPLVLSVIIQN
jgi:hypothetical protein